MDKVVSSPAEAVADIVDGATIGIAGFGVAHRFPSSLITALRDRGVKGLTVYCNGLGQPGHPTAHLLADGGQIAHLVTCFSARPGVVSAAERAIGSGQMTLEMVPQGTLVERMRATLHTFDRMLDVEASEVYQDSGVVSEEKMEGESSPAR